MKPQFIPTEWSGIIAGLQADKFDVIVNQVGITDARKQTLDFSPAYTYSNAQLIQRKDDTRDFKTLDELKDTIRKNILREREHHAQEEAKHQLLDKLPVP